jgi:hypothetical protein
MPYSHWKPVISRTTISNSKQNALVPAPAKDGCATNKTKIAPHTNPPTSSGYKSGGSDIAAMQARSQLPQHTFTLPRRTAIACS